MPLTMLLNGGGSRVQILKEVGKRHQTLRMSASDMGLVEWGVHGLNTFDERVIIQRANEVGPQGRGHRLHVVGCQDQRVVFFSAHGVRVRVWP